MFATDKIGDTMAVSDGQKEAKDWSRRHPA